MSQRVTIANLGAKDLISGSNLGPFVRIPLPWTRVPIRLQTFFVLLSGLALGRTMGIVSQACYLATGALGQPFFAGTAGGLAVLAGPTGEYLVGFPIATWVVGWIAGRSMGSWLWTLLTLNAGALGIDILMVNCGVQLQGRFFPDAQPG